MQQAAREVLSALGRNKAQLSILVTDDEKISELNQTYLNRPGPTNVIAFPMQEGEFSDIQPDLLGDVVISIETACREAEAAGMATGHRFFELLVHGILHLAGYDHVSDANQARLMEEKTVEIMRLLEEKGLVEEISPL